MMAPDPFPDRTTGAAVSSSSDPLRIDCADCALQHTPACDDCVVTFICSREPGDAVVVDLVELRALEAFGAGGLLPGLRHERRADGPRAGTSTGS